MKNTLLSKLPHHVLAIIAIIFLGVLSFNQPTQAASFTIDFSADTDDANPGNGSCADAGGNCTLRAAIQEANALGGSDVINCRAGDSGDG